MANSKAGKVKWDFQGKRGTREESRHARDTSETRKEEVRHTEWRKGKKPRGRTQINRKRLI